MKRVWMYVDVRKSCKASLSFVWTLFEAVAMLVDTASPDTQPLITNTLVATARAHCYLILRKGQWTICRSYSGETRRAARRRAGKTWSHDWA